MAYFKQRHRWRHLAGAALVAGIAAGAAMAAAAPGQDPALRVEALENAADTLGLRLDAMSIVSGTPPMAGERLHVAQSREVAQINVRLDQLEERMRVLTGQVEGLQFQLTQLQAMIERMQQDFELRFQDLEGGGPGKTDAAPLSVGVTPSGPVSPQPSTDVRLTPEPLTPERLTPPSDVGESLDPLLNSTGDTIEGILGTLPADLFDRPSTAVNPNGEQLAAPSDRVSDADAQAQYNAGFEALQRGDNGFAEQQFRQFLGLYPRHPLAPNTVHWLGESLLQQGRYDEAAQVLVSGFETYPNSERAPDMLLKLGVALAGAGERETACRTFLEVLRRYPGQPPVFAQRVASEQQRAQC